MKPLIKWPGGKAGELSHLLPLVPEFARFHEPFAGGAALFFALEPERGHISDVNGSLTNLYQHLAEGPRRDRLAPLLRALTRAWSIIGQVGDAVGEPVVGARARWAASQDEVARIAADAVGARGGLIDDAAGELAGVVSAQALHAACVRSLTDKLTRIRRSERRGVEWDEASIAAQAHTAIRAGFYTLMRDGIEHTDPAHDALRFFFLREYAYGAMFRLNRSGRFNVPYGGRSYDGKNLDAKVARLLSVDVARLLARTQISCEGYRWCFDRDLDRDDFVFVDPPYDSTFSTYDGHRFGPDDQRALAEAVAASDARCLVVIGRTPLIERVYREAARGSRHRLVIEDYEVTYATNIKGRYQRGFRHMAIRNYEI